ncbi:rho GTPase-activating protein 12-like, partial [Osmerus mordax]|uniref:rho GTPase-activating protein 12-like n=1 Tax=Osmerus mordax TaxID=8014 RepID=UPI00350F84D2
MADLPIAPGQVYIEVEYDYEYKAKERLITIHQGEHFLLVKKSNEDWWQVRRDEGAKPFYVPAQYVREVRKALMPPPKHLLLPGPATASRGTQEVRRSNENLNRSGGSESSVLGLRSHSPSSPSPSTSSGHPTPPTVHRNANHSPGSDNDHALPEAPPLPGSHAGYTPPHPAKRSTLPRIRARSPDLQRAPLDVDSTQHCDSAGEGSERRTNDSESGEELSSSSTEHLQTVSLSGQGRPDSPVYTNLQELKISQSSQPPAPSSSPLHVLGDWETHKDVSGRHFYYNRSSQERTWKPPRAREAGTGSCLRATRHSSGDAEVRS